MTRHTNPTLLIAFLCVMIPQLCTAQGRSILSRGTFEEFPAKNSLHECTLGHTPGCRTERKFGQNPAVSATEEDLWDGGGSYSWYPTTEVAVDCASNNAADTAAGTGARTITVTGLTGSGWTELTELAVMNGTAPVTLANAFVRIFRIRILTAGSSKTNAGIIFCESTGAAGGLPAGDNIPSIDDAAQMPPGNGSTAMSIYTVPGDKQAIFVNLSSAVGKNQDATVRTFVRINSVGIAPDGGWILGDVNRIYQGSHINPDSTMGVLRPKTDVRIAGTSSAPNTPITATFMVYLYDAD